MKIQKHSGWMLEWTSYLHNVIGVILFWKPIQDIFQAGVWNAVEPHYDRALIFWFIWFGLMMWILAKLFRWITVEKRMILPASVGWYVVFLSLLGGILIPVSGFWLVIPQGIYIIVGARSTSS